MALRLLFFFLFWLLTSAVSLAAAATSFSFASFSPNDGNISVSGGTIITDGALRLTDSDANSTGRAQYDQPIQLRDPLTNTITNFTTYFEFTISFPTTKKQSSSGFAFFLTSSESAVAPGGSSGGWLGLFNETTNGDPSNKLVAVEFDTYRDQWDPSDNHVGVDVNSIVSKASRTWRNNMSSGRAYAAQISYVSTSKTLRVHVRDMRVRTNRGSLDLVVPDLELMEILPKRAVMGFSASTGSSAVVQSITKWNFTSSLDLARAEGGGSKMSVLVVVAPLLVLLAGVAAFVIS